MSAQVLAQQAFCIRTPTPDDELSLLAMWDRCSVDTRYARFLSPVPYFPPGHLADVLASGPARWSWIGLREDTGDVVGLASLFRTGAATGELGLLVEDGHQRQGLGTALLTGAAAYGRAVSIETLTATTLVEAHHVRRMLERMGRVAARREGFTTELSVTLDPHIP
jgi:GNAT superfamily N-acetyltransferase